MIFRRIKTHIEKENWFAVGLDFFIVVVGILLAFQITSWNEDQQAKINEQAALNQLQSEFTEIRTELKKQILIREEWAKELGLLISILEGNVKAEDSVIKSGLRSATQTGRQPVQSAVYLQLMASGELSLLSNEQLRQALVSYHIRLQRDALIHPELMNLTIAEASTNTYVDSNVTYRTRGIAPIDQVKGSESSAEYIISYDLEGLRTLENRYETMYTIHIYLLSVDELKLDIANEILDLISNEIR